MAELFNDSSLFGNGSSNAKPTEVIAEMLDYDYISRCSSIEELKAILQCLETGKFGRYPHLENTVKDKLDKLSNTKQRKKVQVISSYAADEECDGKESIQNWLTNGIDSSQASTDKADTTLPPVRTVTNTNLGNVEVKPKVVVKKSNPPAPKSNSITKKAASTATTKVFRKEKLSTQEYFDRWDKFDVDKALAAVDDSDEEEEVQPNKQTEKVAQPKVVAEKESSPAKQFHRMAITEVDTVDEEEDVVEEVFTPGAVELESTQTTPSAPSKVVKDNKSSATAKDSQTSNTIPNDTTTKAPDSSWQKISIVETSDSDEELVDTFTKSSSSMRRVDIVEETLTDSELAVLDSEKFKTEGNTAMNEKRYSDAVRFYTLALDTNPDNTLALANRSSAYIKLEGMCSNVLCSIIPLSSIFIQLITLFLFLFRLGECHYR